jgi:integrase
MIIVYSHILPIVITQFICYFSYMRSKLGLVSLEEVFDFASFAVSENTRRAYGADWEHFLSWCKAANKPSLPAAPDDIASYLRHCSEKLGLKISTVQRRLSAVSEAHKKKGLPSPAEEWVVKNTIKRLKRENLKPTLNKRPILVEDLKKMLALCPDTLSGKRDKAVLLIGFTGAFKRSEIASLNISDLTVSDLGLVIDKKRKVAIPYGDKKETCPVTALLDWIEAAKISEGPVFRGVTKFERSRYTRMSDRVVTDIVKKYSALLGKRLSFFSGHSLRAGLAVSAAIAGASEALIQKQTGHKSLLVLRRYTRDANLFRDNAASKLGL